MPKRSCSIRKQILCSAFCLSKVLQWIPALDLAFITFSAYPLLPPSSTLHCNSNSLQRAEVPPPSLLHCVTLQQQLSAMQQCRSTSSSLPPTSHCSSAVQSSNSSRSTFPIEQQVHQITTGAPNRIEEQFVKNWNEQPTLPYLTHPLILLTA